MESDLIQVGFTEDQLTLIERALDAMLYEDAPQHLRNNGFALEPGEEGEIDEDDEEQVEYADTYPKVQEIEAIISSAKHAHRNLRRKDHGAKRAPEGQREVLADRSIPETPTRRVGVVRAGKRTGGSNVRKPKRRK